MLTSAIAIVGGIVVITAVVMGFPVYVWWATRRDRMAAERRGGPPE